MRGSYSSLAQCIGPSVVPGHRPLLKDCVEIHVIPVAGPLTVVGGKQGSLLKHHRAEMETTNKYFKWLLLDWCRSNNIRHSDLLVSRVLMLFSDDDRWHVVVLDGCHDQTELSSVLNLFGSWFIGCRLHRVDLYFSFRWRGMIGW